MGFKKPLKLSAGFCAVVGAPVLLYSAISGEMESRTPVSPHVAASVAVAPAEAPAEKPQETLQIPPADQALSPEERNRFAPVGTVGNNEQAFIDAVERGYRSAPSVRVWPYVAGNNHILPVLVQEENAVEATASAASAQRQRIPFWQFWRRWESAERPAEVCAFSADEYNEELVRVAALIDELREDGLTENEWRFQNDCMSSLTMPQAMADLDDAKVQALFNDTRWRNRLTAKFSDWTPREEWATYGTATAAYNQRLEAFQFLNESMHRAYGYKAPRIVLLPLEDHHLLRGQYHHNFQGTGPAIVMNSNAVFTTMDNPEHALRTLVEEIKHSIDNQMASEFFARKIHKDDPRFQHASIIFMNNRAIGYASPQVYFQNGELVGDRQSYSDYAQQYLERTAKQYAGRFVGLSGRAMHGEAMPWEEEQPAPTVQAPKPSV